MRSRITKLRRKKMSDKVLLYSLVMLFGTLISSISQVMLKKSSQKEYGNVYKEYLNPLVITAYFIFFLATLCTVFAYKEIPLSLGPMLESTGYLNVTVFSALLFKERITGKKIIALSIIIIGIVIYSVFG